jgi:hypothetical protein
MPVRPDWKEWLEATVCRDSIRLVLLGGEKVSNCRTGLYGHDASWPLEISFDFNHMASLGSTFDTSTCLFLTLPE